MSDKLNQSSSKISRRTLLRTTAAGTTVLFTGGMAVLLQGCNPQKTPQRAVPAVKSMTSASAPFTPDVEIALTATKSTAQILLGAPTAVWTYRGEVLKGAATVLQALPNAYLGPIIRVRTGQKMRVHFKNDLAEDTIIHWHGLIVPPAMDGHPQDAVGPGQTYVYEFEVKNRAGTYWFHPHPHGRTGPQVNMGLAGLFIVSDAEEEKAGLPIGAQDVALVLQDRNFDTRNQFVYVASGGMMDQMMGFLGDRMLVNGQTNFTLPVATRAYRLRLLNGSSSRVYKLAWSNGAPLTVIASDGGLLAKPVQRGYVTLGPGERVELWMDFSGQKVGAEIKLQSLAYEGVEAGMMGDMMAGMMQTATIPNGAPFDVLTVRVEKAEEGTLTPPEQALPATLSVLERYQLDATFNASNPRSFTLSMNNMQWLINDKTFAMDAVDANEQVAFNSLEVWEFINQQGSDGMGGMMGGGMMNHGNMGADNMSGNQGMMADFMAHPMHIHGVQFQVVERQIADAQRAGWATLKDGYVDEGWKDTVLVLPGERVKVLARFSAYPGRYLVHCHNLEHEDMGMMRNYVIKA